VPRGPAPGAADSPLALLLYLPIAALLSGALGLLLVRLLARRLRALEALAGRVAAGDLSARVADPHGDEIGRVAAQLDRMTERLAAARDQLQASERQRRQLFADITHELATPLTSIRGATETLLNPQVAMSDDERTRYMRGVLEESHRLDRLIRDLFELARLEAGATPLDRERLDWAALCRNTIERFAPRYAAAGLRLEWTASRGEAWIEADGLRLEQVLDNLLVNALRYVPARGRVTVALEGPSTPPRRWRMVVSDDGAGIPAEELPHVFERFYRGASARGPQGARENGGSGLGLAIVREIVERHGGAVRARPATPHGLAIEVELPALG
jgi:signal transduction histidine kinase